MDRTCRVDVFPLQLSSLQDDYSLWFKVRTRLRQTYDVDLTFEILIHHITPHWRGGECRTESEDERCKPYYGKEPKQASTVPFDPQTRKEEIILHTSIHPSLPS
jgi:hypothetical protein